jgi:hypothetical protein
MGTRHARHQTLQDLRGADRIQSPHRAGVGQGSLLQCGVPSQSRHLGRKAATDRAFGNKDALAPEIKRNEGAVPVAGFRAHRLLRNPEQGWCGHFSALRRLIVNALSGSGQKCLIRVEGNFSGSRRCQETEVCLGSIREHCTNQDFIVGCDGIHRNR